MRRFALSFPSQKENQVSISRPAETQPQLRVSYLQHHAVFDACFCASGLAGSLRLLLRVAIAVVSTGRTIAERPSTQLQQLHQCHAAALLLVNVCTQECRSTLSAHELISQSCYTNRIE